MASTLPSTSIPRLQDSGTTQLGRRQPALLESRVLLADHSTEELLAYIAHFSKLVRYYEVQDGRVQSHRTWNLGQQRSLLVVALIANQRLTTQYEFYSRLEKQLLDPMATTAQRQQAQQQILDRIYKMAQQFDDWQDAHQHNQARRTFQAELTTATETLAGALQQAVRAEQVLIADYGQPPRPARRRQPEQLTHIWQPLASAAQMSEAGPATQQQLQRRTTTALWDFHKAQVALAALAHRVLIKELHTETTEKHDLLPEMALIVTFLELYQHAQQALNHIPRRHLDYYYQQVLRVAARPSRPDHAFLTFALAKGVTSHLLPAGTEIEGGKDVDGQRVAFRTTQDEQLTDWRVRQLSTLFVSGHATDAVKGVYLAPQADSVDGQGVPFPNPATGWPAFGEDQDLLSPAYRTMTDASVGFAVSAAVLLMQEGRRAIELRLRCTPASIAHFRQVLTGQGQALPRAFDALALAAFRIDITGAEGWLPLRTDEVYLEQDTVIWHLSLGREQAAIVAHQVELHAGQFQSAWPVLRLVLNPRAPYYGYSSFSALQPVQVGLRVHVSDVQEVQLSNSLGPLAPGMPFTPFGPQARAGSYLLVGFAELFHKRLTSLILTLDWAQLPTDADGFADYYRGYNPPITNESFRVAASYRRDWRWVPETLPATTRPLFQTLPDSTRRLGTVLQPSTHLVLATGANTDFRRQPLVAPANQLGTGPTGAIRVELTEPASGFGDDQYPPLLVETMHYNARHASQPRPLPRPPFSPLVQNLWLSYTAEEELETSALFGPASTTRPQFYHLHPLSSYQPTHPASPVNHAAGTLPGGVGTPFALGLLPKFTEEGTLYIGLENLVLPQTINLLFELAPSLRLPYQPDMARGQNPGPTSPAAAADPTAPAPLAASGYSTKEPTIQWHYLVQDEWRPFAQGATLRPDVVHDQSQNLTELKPVYLTLPVELDTQHTIMPSGLYWLRATVEHGAVFVSRIRAVHPQVVPAVRVGATPDLPVAFSRHLPPDSLTRLVKPVPALARVAQPLSSFDGRPAETSAEYNTRVSERLRHRGRALTSWDYEHLTLEQFPEVFRVKCLRANQISAARRRPGLVLLMVMPYQSTVGGGYRLPTFSPAHLARIRGVLQQVAPPHVQLEVCNPLYELIQVRCQISFTPQARRSHPQPGVLVGQVQAALHEFLSPWNTAATRQGLHNTLTSSTIRTFLGQLPYVEFVGGFSVVKMALEDDSYLYYDTEGLAPDGTTPPEPLPPNQVKLLEDTFHRPWSLYVSAAQHYIEDVGSMTATPPVASAPDPAKPTGIGRLVIGSSFIIPRSFDPRSPNDDDAASSPS